MSASKTGAGRGSNANGSGRRRQTSGQARQRRDADRARRLEHDAPTTKRGQVKLNEAPLGLPVKAPKWLPRGWRGLDDPVGDRAFSEVTKAVAVYGPTLPGQPWGWVKYRLSASQADRWEALLRQQRRTDYTNRWRASASTGLIAEPSSDHRSQRAQRAADTSAHRKQHIRRNVKAHGAACGECGLMHRGECL